MLKAPNYIGAFRPLTNPGISFAGVLFFRVMENNLRVFWCFTINADKFEFEAFVS